MLLRFIAENIFSFREATEFNLFPSCKTHSHDSHKVTCGHAVALRMSALYGANGAGKSNLIRSLGLLQSIVAKGSLDQIVFPTGTSFMYDEACRNKPSALAIEFSVEGNVYYYQIEFDGQQIYSEELYLSGKTKDDYIFKRSGGKDDTIAVELSQKYASTKITTEYLDAIRRLQRPDMSMLNFIGQYYAEVFPSITSAYRWFKDCLLVERPNMRFGITPYMMDSDPAFASMVNEKLPYFKTGISRLVSVKEVMSEQEAQTLYKAESDLARKTPGQPIFAFDKVTGELFNLVALDGKLMKILIMPQHEMPDGQLQTTPYFLESDGTHRIIDFMPVLYLLLTRPDYVFVVDEIERSVHPVLIKELMRSVSESKQARGQLIFSTHESSLLDQSIFRPDEIWFAQKDADASTKLYPLSDFNIHNTANIENGYLQGRYGGIPFLSNIKDLNW